MAAIQFLTRVGKMTTETRQEFVLLSDVLGVSALVDTINNPRMRLPSCDHDACLRPLI